MSSHIGDLNTYFAANTARTKTGGTAKAGPPVTTAQANDKFDMNMQDFLMLIVAEMQNQSLDSTADTSEMLNQMVMMQMVNALTNMTDVSVMGYAASLVGKTVTVGQYDSNGVLQEVEGVVTGTGMMGGKQVVFVGDKYYYLNEILAVGKLPPKPEGPEGGDGTEKPEGGGGTEKPEGGGGTEKPEGGTDKVPEDNKVDPPKDDKTEQTPAARLGL